MNSLANTEILLNLEISLYFFIQFLIPLANLIDGVF